MTCETELISLIHKKAAFETGGTLYGRTTKEKIGKINKVLVYSFWVYNKSGELLKRRGRNKKMEEEHPFDPIDRLNCIIIHKKGLKKLPVSYLRN